MAAVSGKKICVLAFNIVSAGTNTLAWKSNTTALTGVATLAVNNVWRESYATRGHFETVAGEALNIDSTAAVLHGGWLVYAEVDA